MLELGSTVTFRNRSALVVARTYGSPPRYDLRLANGGVVKYVLENEIVTDDGPPARAAAALPYRPH